MDTHTDHLPATDHIRQVVLVLLDFLDLRLEEADVPIQPVRLLVRQVEICFRPSSMRVSGDHGRRLGRRK